MNEAILETEKLVQSLSDELLKLKSAVERYEENRKGLNAIREILESIGNASSVLAENTRQFLAELNKIGFEPRLQQIQDDSAKLVQGHAKQLDSLKNIQDNLNRQGTTIEQNYKDQLSKLRDHDERMHQASLDQAKKLRLTQGLILALLALEAATLAAIFIR